MDKLERMKKSKIPGPETGIEVRKSVCTICDPTTQCGLDCYVSDRRIIKIEGSKENPEGYKNPGPPQHATMMPW